MKTYCKQIQFNNQRVDVSPAGSIILENGAPVSIRTVQKAKKGASPFRYTEIGGKTIAVHRLVALAYVENPKGYKMVLHKDTDTLNNHYRNLEWGNQRMIAENMKAAGRSYRTEKHVRLNSKIKLMDISDIMERINQGDTLRSIAKDYNTSDMSIHRVKERYKKLLK